MRRQWNLAFTWLFQVVILLYIFVLYILIRVALTAEKKCFKFIILSQVSILC